MIAQVRGQLVDIFKDRIWVTPGSAGSDASGLTYELLVPAFVTVRLALQLGKPVTLQTLCFMESQNQGATFTPRLAGFLTRDDLAFFELVTGVKGIGNRRALRAMVLDTATLANAIADRDAKLLQTLPEVGKKLAETIIVTLKDKVDRFLSASAYGADAAKSTGELGARGDQSVSGGVGPRKLAREALEVLLQLGEQRTDAVQLIDRVLAGKEPPDDVQGILEAVYRLKAQA